MKAALLRLDRDPFVPAPLGDRCPSSEDGHYGVPIGRFKPGETYSMHEVRDEFVLFGPGICRFFKGETNIVLNRHPFEEAVGMEVETPVALRI